MARCVQTVARRQGKHNLLHEFANETRRAIAPIFAVRRAHIDGIQLTEASPSLNHSLRADARQPVPGTLR
eukprot:6650539-Lingulodinium_polyedra.AAC.1